MAEIPFKFMDEMGRSADSLHPAACGQGSQDADGRFRCDSLSFAILRYHRQSVTKLIHLLLNEQLLHPGQRVAMAVSGGADSVSLLRALVAKKEALGLVLSVAHVHHGIRGDAADRDQAFVETSTATHGLQLHLRRVDTPARAAKQGETLEESARNLRYAFFDELLQSGQIDVVATAHTLDDQAETVLQKFLRGAWTEGLGGISPVVHCGKGRIVRPLLAVTRREVEDYLQSLNQPWCEDATNQDLAHTRNRVRHHLLPILKEYNPQLATQLSRLSTIARDEEIWWQSEVSRVGISLLLPGKPVRGGGRASSTHPDEASVAFELERLRVLEPAMRRRVIRWAAAKVHATLDFEQTERLLQMCAANSTWKRVDLDSSLSVQRTARELQFIRTAKNPQAVPVEAMELPIPGRIEHPSGWIFTAEVEAGMAPDSLPAATIRTIRPGDRVTLRHTRGGPKKVKEVLERLRLPALDRGSRLVLAWQSQVLWMEGLELETTSVPFRWSVRLAEKPV